jgi:hypothetical protein
MALLLKNVPRVQPSHAHIGIAHISRGADQPECPSTEEQVKCGVYIVEYYSATKSTTWTYLEVIMLNESSQAQEGKHGMLSLMSGI